ncbi:uncharacterized protein [Drosophila takahashii]|uniref:uncharacterized protein isoform X3 n=1 Tax=Drosophila takahashii TaxID=29030 RepID=UPI0038992A92
MNRAIFCLFIVLKAGMTECGLKSHAELIRQADKVDKKIKAYKLTGFAKGNSEFDENYKNLRIPLSENYTNLHNKLEHIRVFEAYNKERLQLEKGIMSIISKMNTSTTENCEKFYKKLRQHLVLKLTDANLNKMEALKNIQNRFSLFQVSSYPACEKACEELNNSSQIAAARITDGRQHSSYAAN